MYEHDKSGLVYIRVYITCILVRVPVPGTTTPVLVLYSQHKNVNFGRPETIRVSIMRVLGRIYTAVCDPRPVGRHAVTLDRGTSGYVDIPVRVPKRESALLSCLGCSC